MIASSRPLFDHDTIPNGSLEDVAAAFARRSPDETEELIERLCADAVRQWCLQDATFWQRVKFRARMLRALNAPPEDAPMPDLPAHDRRD